MELFESLIAATGIHQYAAIISIISIALILYIIKLSYALKRAKNKHYRDVLKISLYSMARTKIFDHYEDYLSLSNWLNLESKDGHFSITSLQSFTIKIKQITDLREAIRFSQTKAMIMPGNKKNIENLLSEIGTLSIVLKINLIEEYSELKPKALLKYIIN